MGGKVNSRPARELGSGCLYLLLGPETQASERGPMIMSRRDGTRRGESASERKLEKGKSRHFGQHHLTLNYGDFSAAARCQLFARPSGCLAACPPAHRLR